MAMLYLRKDDSNMASVAGSPDFAPPNKTVYDCPMKGVGSNTTASVSEEHLLKCGNCDQTFPQDHLLYFHLRVHIPRQHRWLCPHCPYVSTDAGRLEAHLQEKHLVSIRCNVCLASVGDTRADLSSHLYSCHIVKKTRARVSRWPRFDSDKDVKDTWQR